MKGDEHCYEQDVDLSSEHAHQANTGVADWARKPSAFSVNQLPAVTSARHEVLICRTFHEIVEPRSLPNEVRAIRDLNHFFKKPNVALDIECNRVEMIIEQLLEVSVASH